MTVPHSGLTGVNHHVPGYVQAGDPGAVGTGIAWIDTSASPYLLKIRDATDTGWDTIGPLAHASGHERTGSDQIDGDHLDIDFTPSNYTPDTTPAEAANVDDLAAHLYGIDVAIGSVGGGSPDVVIYRHAETSGTGGGTTTTGSDQTLTVNDEAVDTGSHGTAPSSNQFDLDAGTYEFLLMHTSRTNIDFQIWLYDVDGAADVADSRGLNTYASGNSIVYGRVTIASQNTFEIRYRSDTTLAGGLGTANSWGEEVYGIYIFWKVA